MSAIFDFFTKLLASPTVSAIWTKFSGIAKLPFTALSGTKQDVFKNVTTDMFTDALSPESFTIPALKSHVETLRTMQPTAIKSYGHFSQVFLHSPIEILFDAYWLMLDVEPPVTLEKAQAKRKELMDTIIQFLNYTTTLSITAQAISVGLLSGIMYQIQTIANVMGFDSLYEKLTDAKLKANVITPLEHDTLSTSQTTLPDAPSMIAAAKLELLEEDVKLTPVSDAAAKKLALHGFDKYWSDVMYSSSLEPPNIGDYITDYARTGSGKPNIEKVKDILTKVQAIVNMDMTRFGDVLTHRAFSAPNLIQLRTGYESGAYTTADVEKWLRWQMIHPDWWDNTLASITRFASRAWNNRYVQTLGKEYIANIIDAEAFSEKLSSMFADSEVRHSITRYYDEYKLYLSKKPTRAAILKMYQLPLRTYISMIISGQMDLTEAAKVLAEKGLSDRDNTLLIGSALWARDMATYRLPPMTYLSAAKLGIISEETFISILRMKRMSETDVNILLNMLTKAAPAPAPVAPPTLTKADILALVKEGKMWPEEGWNRLIVLGYSLQDIGYLFAEIGVAYRGIGWTA